MPINADGLSLREYVSASVGAAQANIMRQMEQNLTAMIPRIVRESLRSERNSTFENNNNSFGSQNRRNNNEPNYRDHPQQQHQQQRQQTDFNIPQSFMSPNTIRTQPTNTPLQLEKWGIKFDGSNKTFSVEDFVFRVEALREDYNCPWEVLMKGFHHLMTGRANEWFWTFRRQNPICQWDVFKYNLVRKFRNFESDFEIQRRILERRQMPTETADTYITEIVKLKNQMRSQIHEYELVRIIKDNLKDGLAQLIFPIEIENVDELLFECKRAERNIAKRAMNRPQQPNFRRVNEMEYTELDYEDDFEIAALKNNMTPSKPPTCWNCKQPGHSFMDCTLEQRNLFCYRCGFEGVITPKCPKCVGNIPRNMVKSGPTCSPQNTAQ